METRFLSHVEKTESCWLWTGVKVFGYGKFKVNGKADGAHRTAYELWVGKIPDGLVVRHKCRHRHCVNPDHLETGTPKENTADRVRDGTDSRGENNKIAKLTADQVRDIRSRVGQTLTDIADEFGVEFSTIGKIIRRNSWKHVT